MPDDPILPFTPPTEGGAYVLNEDGTLTRVTDPTVVPPVAPQGE